LVDVDAINHIVVPEKSRVLARTARDVEYRACAGHELTDQTAEPITFTRIILEAIDRVIKLCTFDEYAVTRHAFIRCRVQDGMQNSGPIAPRNASYLGCARLPNRGLETDCSWGFGFLRCAVRPGA